MHYVLLSYSLLRLASAFPGYLDCNDARLKVGGDMGAMGKVFAATGAGSTSVQVLRDSTPATTFMEGEQLVFHASGFKASASAVLHVNPNANVSLLTRDGDSDHWVYCPSCKNSTNQLNVDDNKVLSGTEVTLYVRLGCGNTLAAGEKVTVSFVWGVAAGAPMYISTVDLTPEIDNSTMKPKQSDVCRGGAGPTLPPPLVTSTTYTNLVWIHRWGVILSWGFLFPLGVSLVRNYPSGSRLKLHRWIQCLGLVVEIVEFTCIVTAHQIGKEGLGPQPGDDNFWGTQGNSPGATHKQRGLAVFMCVLLQVMFGFFRPAPYPNNFKRRLWLWAHRSIGDGGMVVAWVQIWESVVWWQGTDQAAYVSMTIVASIFMASAMIVVPIRCMLVASLQESDLEEQGSVISSATPSLSNNLARVLAPDAADGDHPRDAVFYGCGYCNQVFTGKHILQVHIQFSHPGCEYRDIQSPMTQKFAEVSNTPAVNDGIPLSEVRNHNTKGDCWVVINSKVYDLTNFLKIHPGGANPILSWAGRDASKVWNPIHQKSWLNKYGASIECLGAVGPEPPVPGMTSSFDADGGSGLHQRPKQDISLVATDLPDSMQSSLMGQP